MVIALICVVSSLEDSFDDVSTARILCLLKILPSFSSFSKTLKKISKIFNWTRGKRKVLHISLCLPRLHIYCIYTGERGEARFVTLLVEVSKRAVSFCARTRRYRFELEITLIDRLH